MRILIALAKPPNNNAYCFSARLAPAAGEVGLAGTVEKASKPASLANAARLVLKIPPKPPSDAASSRERMTKLSVIGLIATRAEPLGNIELKPSFGPNWMTRLPDRSASSINEPPKLSTNTVPAPAGSVTVKLPAALVLALAISVASGKPN